MSTNPRQVESFVVVNLDRVTSGATQVQAALEPLGIPVEVVESGRQLRWHSAVVLRVPGHRVADAMLALAMKGFGDVMAYQANEGGR